MMSDATSDGETKWKSEVDQVVKELPKSAIVEWWRVVQFLYRNYIQHNRGDFPLQFDLHVSNDELYDHDGIILQEISKRAGSIIIFDGGTFFNKAPSSKINIQDDIQIVHKPGAIVIPNAKIEYLHHKLKEQVRHKPQQEDDLPQLITRSGLALDLGKTTLTYGNNPPLTIKPSNVEIKMLACLMKSSIRVTYAELGRVTNTTAYSDLRGNDSAPLRQAIQMTKLSLLKTLRKAGVAQKTANAIIKTVPKEGYLFVDQKP